MTDLKAYACMEPYENTGAVIFAKSNIEARRWGADEFHDGELAGMIVNRAPWADKYGSRNKVPISVMVDNGWHFECCWSGVTIDSEIYEYGVEIWNPQTNEYEYDETLKGKEPVGFQESIYFACQEYADKWYEYKRLEKEFHEQELKYYRGIVLKNFPDAILMNGEGYMRRESIGSYDMKSGDFIGHGLRYVNGLHIPFGFPGMKHWAALEYRQPEYGKIGPTCPDFICANGDLEEFKKWSVGQKEKIKNDKDANNR